MSKLPRLISRLPDKAGIALAALLFLVVLGGIALFALSGKEPDSGSNVVAAPTPTVTPTPAPSETAPPPAPNRQDCPAILNTPFLSPEEAAWYRANCARSDGPAVAASGSTQVPIGDTLVIPAAGIKTTISRTTVGEDLAMPNPVGYFNALWYDFSKFENYGGYANAGNLVLSGHVDCARCVNGGSGTAIFWNVRNLKIGDTAQYQMANGTVLDYVVVSSQALSVNSDWNTIVSSSTADMTLITCTGTFSGGEYNQRHVVAMKIKV